MATAPDKIVDTSAAYIDVPIAAADWLIVAPLVLCMFFGAALLMFRKDVALQPRVAIVALTLLALIDAGLLWRVLHEGTLVMTMGRWFPPFGIAFTVDVMSAIFALTAAVVALAAVIYAAATLETTATRYGFYPFVVLMVGGVSGAFLTGDIFNLYVWFEVLLIGSFGLLILGSEQRQIDGAVKYAFLNLIGTTLFLIATGLLYGVFGTLNMADIARKVPHLPDSAPLTTLAFLYLLAFGMKAAAFPVNAWLPASYHTPRMVVGALFAGLLTKVGVYALLRTMLTILPAERDTMALLIAMIAALTMILGVLGALAQSDLRRTLGFTVVSGIGVMFAGIALASPTGLAGTVLYAVHSMIVMTALYLLVGLMERRAGHVSLHRLGGFYAWSPLMAAMALVLFFSVAGLPPFSGVWPKVMLVKASIDVGAWWLAAAILVTGLLTSIAYGRVFLLAFWRPLETGSRALADGQGAGRGAILALAALVALVVAMGIWPEPFIAASYDAATSLLNQPAYIDAVFPPEAAR
jgi:multicomponent Na+:H+ antiporter subunit D